MSQNMQDLQERLVQCREDIKFSEEEERVLLKMIKDLAILEEEKIIVKHGDVCQAKDGLRIIIFNRRNDKLQSLSSDGTIQIENIEQGQDVLCHQEYVVLYNIFTSESCGTTQR